MGVVIYGLLILLFIVRVFEWPWGRPISPFIVTTASRLSLIIMGINLTVKGRPLSSHGAIVSNHIGWLDIFVCSSAQRAVFVAKSEVANWIGIGILAKATGTIFLDRNPRHALRQKIELTNRMSSGDQLLFFPEGTSTDGLRVLNFNPTLFSVLFSPELGEGIEVQPMTIRYLPLPSQDAAFYGYWGSISFFSSLFKVLSAPRNGKVELVCHSPVRVADFSNRKELALYCESKVRQGLESKIER